MNPLWLVIAGVVGLACGAAHALGLWWTVRRLPGARRPGLLLAASFAVRAALVVAPILLVSDGRFERAAAALAGFILGRTVAARALGRGKGASA